MASLLKLTRAQILAHRRRASHLDERLPAGNAALQRIAQAGLQDSMPRAALLSIHARMTGVRADVWEHPSLVQIWGPRYNAYVVAATDRAVFTLGRLPVAGPQRQRAQAIASRLATALAGRRLRQSEAAKILREKDDNRLRYAATTGTVLIRWDGARQPDVWSVTPPATKPEAAQRELARRYLHVFGTGTTESFAQWAGLRPAEAVGTFKALQKELIPVLTPIGPASCLADDETSLRAKPGPVAPARLLPSGDTWYLLQGPDREMLVPDEHKRGVLWTSRVWPGALLVGGETAGIWRRANHVLTLQPWLRLSPRQREAVETEANTLPLDLGRPLDIRWEQA